MDDVEVVILVDSGWILLILLCLSNWTLQLLKIQLVSSNSSSSAVKYQVKQCPILELNSLSLYDADSVSVVVVLVVEDS